MRRGELYLVRKPGRSDPRKQRVFVIVSRQALMDTSFSSLICAPIYSRHDGLSTQVRVGTNEGLKQDSSIHCDDLVSLPKAMLSRFVACLGEDKLDELDAALAVAVGLN